MTLLQAADASQIQINEDLNNKLRPVGSQLGFLYGLAKAHKKVICGCPASQLILSAIGTPTYKLAKFLKLNI